MRTKNRLGFTLIELIVVILIIGILSAFGIPAYMKTLENSKAEDAASVTNMLATANRMYALDHNNQLASGTLDNSCAAAACPLNPGYTACELVACKYVSGMDFDNYSYTLSVGGTCGGGIAACSSRHGSGQPNGTGTSPYSSWGYSVTTNGMISESGGAPTPAQ